MSELPSVPKEALPLLGEFATCYNQPYADYIVRHSRGGLVAVQCDKETLLVPSAVWARVREDVAGIAAEVAARANR